MKTLKDLATCRWCSVGCSHTLGFGGCAACSCQLSDFFMHQNQPAGQQDIHCLIPMACLHWSGAKFYTHRDDNGFFAL